MNAFKKLHSRKVSIWVLAQMVSKSSNLDAFLFTVSVICSVNLTEIITSVREI